MAKGSNAARSGVVWSAANPRAGALATGDHDNSLRGGEEDAMRWVLRRDLVGETAAHEAGPLRIVGSSLRVALASGFTWGAGALAAAFMACWGMGAWVV